MLGRLLLSVTAAAALQFAIQPQGQLLLLLHSPLSYPLTLQDSSRNPSNLHNAIFSLPFQPQRQIAPIPSSARPYPSFSLLLKSESSASRSTIQQVYRLSPPPEGGPSRFKSPCPSISPLTNNNATSPCRAASSPDPLEDSLSRAARMVDQDGDVELLLAAGSGGSSERPVPRVERGRGGGANDGPPIEEELARDKDRIAKEKKKRKMEQRRNQRAAKNGKAYNGTEKVVCPDRQGMIAASQMKSRYDDGFNNGWEDAGNNQDNEDSRNQAYIQQYGDHPRQWQYEHGYKDGQKTRNQ